MSEKPSATLLHRLKSVTVEKVLATESMPLASLVSLCNNAGREIDNLQAKLVSLGYTESGDPVEAGE